MKLTGYIDNKFAKWFIGSVILVDIATSIIFSFSQLDRYEIISHAITFLSALFFTIEYALRIIAAPQHNPKVTPHRARLKYIFSFFGIVDIISILPFAFTYIFNSYYQDIFELARIFLVFKLARYSTSFLVIRDAFRTVKNELIAAYACVAIILYFSAVLMYYVERGAQPEAFNNIGQGFWWAIITFATVGYGDIYPITALGKVLGGFTAFLGVIMFALPTGIVTSAFINRIQNRDKICSHCGKKLGNDDNCQ